MPKLSPALVHRIYAVILSVSILIAALCLMGGCLSLYDSGNGAFSREAVAAVFAPIALPVCLCPVLALLSFPLHWLLPVETGKKKVEKDNRLILQRLRRKADLTACSPDLCGKIQLEQNIRKKYHTISITLIGAVFVIFLAYVLSGDRFLLPDITFSMKQAMLVLLPCLAAAFGYSLFAQHQGEQSLLREIELMKQAVREAPAKEIPSPTTDNINVLRAVLLLAAVALLMVGYFTGGTGDVLTKAINICTECVGLG